MIINQVLIESGEVTTAHGIPNILRAKNKFLKVFWILFLFLATSCALYLITKTINTYLDFEVVTKTTIEKKRPAEFPTITICNNNFLSTPNDKQIFDEYYENIQNQSLIQKTSFLSAVAYNISQFHNKSFGLKLSELIIECSFGNMPCNYATDFVQVYNFLYGNCFRYNSGKDSSGNQKTIKQIVDLGYYNGLQLKVYTGTPELSFSSARMGLHIFIHNSSFDPYFYEGIDVSTGHVTNIAVNRLFISKKEIPYSECISDHYIENKIPDFFKQADNSNNKYRQENCIQLCIQRLQIDTNGCYSLEYDKLNSKKPCLSENETNQAIDFYFNDILTNLLDSYCIPKCPLECESIKYNYLITQASYPTAFYLNSSGLKVSDIENFKKSHLSLNIYYDSFEYTKIEELVKTDFIDLISGIGGTLGLFIGISLLSIIEIFELIFLLIEALFKRDKVWALKNNKR